MQKQFEAITNVEKALTGLGIQDAHRVINYVQAGLYHLQENQCPEKSVQAMVDGDTPVDPAPPKKVAKKRAPAKKKDPVVVPTVQEMMELCVETANRLGSADKIKSLITSICGVDSLKDVTDTATFVELAKKLKDAK